MNGKTLIKILQEHGWRLDRVRGSHHILIKEGRRSIPVPVHGNRDLPLALVRAIIRQAGLNKEDII